MLETLAIFVLILVAVALLPLCYLLWLIVIKEITKKEVPIVEDTKKKPAPKKVLVEDKKKEDK